jgi:acyl-coenzyme A thioesterase PaaI-like protein
MSIPDLEEWRARWRTPERERLGVRGERIEDGFASFIVDLRYGDDRDHDPLFASAAVTHAADVAVLSAVMGHIDERAQQQNGTASIHLNFLRPLVGVLTVEGPDRLLGIARRDRGGGRARRARDAGAEGPVDLLAAPA